MVRIVLLLVLTLNFSFSLLAQYNDPKSLTENDDDKMLRFLLEYLEIKYPSYQFNDFTYVGVKRQKIYLIRDNQIFLSYDVSTSEHGAGIIKNSNMTPIGLHKIKTKIGDNIPENGIFKYRNYTGKVAEIEYQPIKTGLDIISSRIITIEGLELGLNKGGNVDSFDRNIYIHGTNEEGLIGKPASHGCIRMKNQDVIKFYNLVIPGEIIVILNN